MKILKILLLFVKLLTWPLHVTLQTNFSLYCLFYTSVLYCFLLWPWLVQKQIFHMSQVSSAGVVRQWKHILPFNILFTVIIFVIIIIIIISERSFSAGKRLATKMRSTTHTYLLSDLILLVHWWRKIRNWHWKDNQQVYC